MRLATNSFRGSLNLEGSAYYLHATDPGSTGGESFGMTAGLPNDRWNISFSANQVDPNFNPAVGFVTRRGYRRYQPFVEFGPRPRGHRYIRRYLFSTAVDIQNDLQNDLLNRSVELKFYEMQFHSQDSFAGSVTTARERLDTPFSPAPGIILPVGSVYDTTVLNVRGQTANRRVLSVNGYVETGGYYSGTKQTFSMNVNLRARHGIIVYTTFEWNNVKLPEGQFRTRLIRIVSETQFSPWIAWVNNVQYDSVSAVLGLQSRFRWILKPGSDVYLVYTHNWLDDPLQNRMTTLDNRLAAKVLYTHRF